MSDASGNRPWPMKWILLAIILIIVPYTIITLRYRKPGPAFEPYEDIKNRANVTRLLAAGYQRIRIGAARASEPASVRGGALVSVTAAGVPADLRSTLVESPELPAEILGVTAAPSTTPGQPYIIQLTCAIPDDQRQIGGAELYIRGSDVFILLTFEHLAAGVLRPGREDAAQLAIPATALKTGDYVLTLVADQGSRSWPLEVR